MRPGQFRHGLDRSIVLRLVEGKDREILPAQAGKVGLRETDDLGPPGRCVGQASLDPGKPIVKARGDTGGSQADHHGSGLSRWREQTTRAERLEEILVLLLKDD